MFHYYDALYFTVWVIHIDVLDTYASSRAIVVKT